MKKTIVALVISFTMLFTSSAYAQIDFSSLDDLSLDELKELKGEVDTRINALESQGDEAEAYSIITEMGKLSFVGTRMLDASIPAGDSVGKDYVLVIYNYENNTADPKQPQRDFWPTVYQNGVELDSLDRKNVNDTEDYKLLDSFFKSAIKGGVLEFGMAYEIQDDSPLTIILRENGSRTVDPVSFEVNIGQEVDSAQPTTEAIPDGTDDEMAVVETESVETEVVETESVKTEAVETEAKKESKWIVQYYVDDFGDPDMNEPYISQREMVVGTFSNTATIDSKLYAHIVFDDHLVSLFLFEYGDNPVTNSSSRYDDEYDVKFKDEDGNVTECLGVSYPNSDRIWLVNDTGVTNAKNNTDYFTLDDSSKILALFNKDQNLSVSVNERDGLSSYKFKIDTTGFKNAFAQAFPEQSNRASSYIDGETIKEVQEALNTAGYDCGTPDGKADPKTIAALNAYQTANGIEITSEITLADVEALGIQ